MKKIQLSASALAVLLAAGLATSFRLPTKKRNLSTKAWFLYVGAIQDAFFYNMTSNYSYYGLAAPTCAGDGKLCGIQVTVTAIFADHIYTGGSFGAPLGTNIESDLLVRGDHFETGADGDLVVVNNKN
jgi:hypothetical protein